MHEPWYRRARAHFLKHWNNYKEWRQLHRLYDIGSLAFIAGVVVSFIYFIFIAPPLSAPYGALIKIPQGVSVEHAGQILKNKDIIHSSFIFSTIVRTWGSVGVVAGEYSFADPEDVVSVALRLAVGEYQTKPVRVTLFEGYTAEQMGKVLAASLPDFDEAAFVARAKPQEGYLFPDTYFFLPGSEPTEVYAVLRNTFTQKINRSDVQTAIQASGKSLSEIIIMASLIEREAPKGADRRIISGILWKRIARGMPLQVDAAFGYIGVNLQEITKKDLQIDSPYNTYTNKGLPPGPISNPSLDAILAAASPQKSSYLFYLSDKNGTFHYSATYAQHLAYTNQYLR